MKIPDEWQGTFVIFAIFVGSLVIGEAMLLYLTGYFK